MKTSGPICLNLTAATPVPLEVVSVRIISVKRPAYCMFLSKMLFKGMINPYFACEFHTKEKNE